MAAKNVARPEDRLGTQMETHIAALTENFTDIIKLASLGNKELGQVTRETYQVDLHANNIVRSAQALLMLINELKQAVLLHDFAAIGEAQKQRLAQLQKQQQENAEMVGAFKEDLAAAIYQLEAAYNASSYKD